MRYILSRQNMKVSNKFAILHIAMMEIFMKKLSLDEKRAALALRTARSNKGKGTLPSADTPDDYDSQSLLERSARTADRRAASLHSATKSLGDRYPKK